MATLQTDVRERLSALVLLVAIAMPALGQGGNRSQSRGAAPDLTTTPTLYTIGYAHLDTEWNWDYVATIGQYLPKTLQQNFALFEKYPDYVFNFSGANRYHMMKEYYPADYEKMRQYINAGRWFPAGSSMEEGDVNAPSAEAILRQILYGNEYFQKEFGVASAEYMLPDCFGFPWSLPSILAHAGVKGFSTQKLTWGSSVPDQPTTPYGEQGRGIPFNFGYWVGPDGKGVVLAANPGSYSGRVTEDLSSLQAVDRSPPRTVTPQTWMARLQENKQKLGLIADYHYYGTGDTGGSPTDSSVMWVQRAVTNGEAPIRVHSARADKFFLDIKPEQLQRLPRYAGEMELTNHSAGSLTSESYVKRWIRRNEQLADAAERASVAAAWLGGRTYPLDRLNEAWRLVMGSHFHDIAAGTAIPKAYEYAWNDQILSLNQFAGVLSDATDAVASALDTRAQGVAVVVYNPLNVSREDVVEATLSFRAGSWPAVRVYDGAGAEVPAQLETGGDGSTKVLFLAKVPSVGYAVFDVRPATTAAAPSTLSVGESSLENARYRVSIDANGDIASIFDKKLRRELLRAPMRLALQTESPAQWPAWNMDWDDASAPPRAYIGGPAAVRVVESGPVRVGLRIERTSDSSRFVQTIRLSAGEAGNRVEIGNAIDWRGDSAALKATFPLAATNDSATYNWDVGTIKRGNMYDRKFEVPSHQFIDLTDGSGTYGVTLLTDAKNGSDKPDASTLRLTLVYSPGISQGGRGYAVQRWQDWGHHDIGYGLVAHGGDFRRDQTDWQAWRFNQPLIAFESPKHGGSLGKTFSFARISDDRVRMTALKKAERSDELIVRLVEIGGRSHPSVRVSFPTPLTGAREVNGQEQPTGGAMTINGALVTSLTPYAIKSFAVKLRPGARADGPTSRTVPLAYDASVASHDGTHSVGGFDAAGRAIPAEMLPERLPYDGVSFRLVPAKAGVPNAVVPRGQRITLPSGSYNRLYLLAAADGDQQATFAVGNQARTVLVQDWTGYIGQWDNRVFKQVPPSADDLARFAAQQARQDSIRRARIDSVLKVGGDTTAFAAQVGRGGRGQQGPRMVQVYDHLTPGFVKRAPVAWFASHRHTADGANEPYQYSYLFAYAFDVPPGATTLTLPNNDRIRILAATVASHRPVVRAAQPLYDTLERL